MEKLDVRYLAELVEKTKLGGSNAFAELYTATYKSEYAYSYHYLKDENKAKEALEETFVRALKDINKLNDNELILSWLYNINFCVCREIEDKQENILIEDRSYTINQLIKNLPMTEAQVLIMRYYQKISIGELGEMLGIGRSEAKACMKSGKRHLKQLLQE